MDEISTGAVRVHRYNLVPRVHTYTYTHTTTTRTRSLDPAASCRVRAYNDFLFRNEGAPWRPRGERLIESDLSRYSRRRCNHATVI